ncbi:MAG: hypothetical protein KAS98_09945 [Deltaproteobacteria bacterium]|nr:hypothetical protein [Deltaproteobacteria bacterium]MCK5423494.1 hypothetical protein [Deltaproteobacteria bacterium]NOQ85746.1 hypothetical protein [Deltaproteobacteria bacterium]
MGIFSLFELFLVLFTFYAIIKFDGVVRILVPIMCLVVVFLFERLQGRMKEDEEAKKRLLKYKLDDHRKETIQMESEEDIT